MEVSLLTRNKLGFIDRAITRDTYGDKYANLWDRCNVIVKSWIMHNVSRDLLSGVLFCSNACAIWVDLRERFDKVNASRMYYLHREIFTLTQGTSTVSAYYSKLKDLWDEYDSIMSPPTCYDKSKKFVDHQQSHSLVYIKDETKDEENYNLECDYCNMKGHTKDGCYKLMSQQGLGQGQQQLGQQQYAPTPVFTLEQYHQILTMLNKIHVSEAPGSAHMADTWATNHMVGNQNTLYDKVTTGNAGSVHLPTSNSAKVSHVGSCQLNGGETITGSLHWEGKGDCAQALHHYGKNTVWQNDKMLQNWVVERRHKYILETERAIRFQGHLPIRLWGECVDAVVYIINRIPSTVLNNKSPFEVLFGRQASISHMRVLGCLFFITNLVKGDKFGPQAIRSVTKDFRAFPQTTSIANTDCMLSPVSSKGDSSLGIDPVNKEDSTHIYEMHNKSSDPTFSILSSVEDVSLPSPETQTPLVDNHALIQNEIPLACDLRKSGRTIRPPIWLKDYIRPQRGPVQHIIAYT
ncbi:uncharacterized protein LOC142168270 [Nicotiana tabacum]|uniref:Uncharacterized protein LOC142168270 n=1 Tax=Nicotiana tabacum TaxID=4097 RepID=A0AC58SJ88_TOBAC